MKKCIAGSGLDSTDAVKAYLKSGDPMWLATLYLLGEPEDPDALYLTDWESPLSWPCYGVFCNAVIKRGQITSKIGLDVQKCDVTWSPILVPDGPSPSIALSTVYELARAGYYDNWPARMWTAYMPTPGDADTLGCSELFGGWIQNLKISRGEVVFTVESFLNAVNQMVPINVIENTNTLASFKGATPPPDLSYIPQFIVKDDGGAVNTNTILVGDMTSPIAHHHLDDHSLRGGYIVFNAVAGGTASRTWAAIGDNDSVAGPSGSGITYTRIHLYTALPWVPTPNVDTFYASGKFPVDRGSATAPGSYAGFPWVPAPASGL
jgi:hypothetical protein